MLYFTLVVTFIVNLTWAQQAAPQQGNILDHEETGGRGRILDNEDQKAQGQTSDSYVKLSEKYPDIKKTYDFCQEPQNRAGATIEDCLWNNLEDELKQQIIAELPSSGGDGDQESTSSKLAATPFRTTKSKSMRKLEEYLRERLGNILFDQNKKGAKVLTEHSKLYGLYKSQLGQNLMRVLSDTCMSADGNGNIYNGADSAEKKKREDENIKLLSQANSKGQSKAYERFTACIQRIPGQCKNGHSSACVALKYMEESRKTILEVETTIDELNKRSDKQQSSFHQLATREKNNSQEYAKATLLSSGEVKESGLTDVAKEEAELLKKCKEESDAPGPECELYLTEKKQAKELDLEFMIREKAAEEKVKMELDKAGNDTTKQKEVITKILKDEGFSDAQVAQYLAKVSKNKDLTSDIRERYKEKRANLIEEFQGKIARTTKKVPTKTNPDASNKDSYERLEQKTQTLAETLEKKLHFSNVVSSFLQVEKGDGQRMQNTIALTNELDSSAFSDSTKGSLVEQDHNDKLKEMQGGSGQSDSESPASLTSEQIGNLIYGLGDEKKDQE